MKSTVSIVALASIAEARTLGRPGSGLNAQVEQEFLNFQSQYNKHTTTTEDREMRIGIFQNNSQKVIDINRISEERCGDGERCLRVAMNFTGDMTSAELESMMGLANVDESQIKQLAPTPRHVETLSSNSRSHGQAPNHHGRHLQDEIPQVNHVTDGWMGPVKDQGGCGSCVQFAVSSVVEGTLAKQANLATPPHFSEQHLLDCSFGGDHNPDLTAQCEGLFGKNYGGYGCQGSWMRNTYQFLQEQGAVDISTRAYQTAETECLHKDEDVVAKVTDFAQVQGTVQDMKDRVMQQPISVAINASCSAFQLYQSGVILDQDCPDKSLNHAVAVVGFVGGDSPNPTPPKCDVTQWWHTCEEQEADARRMLVNTDQMTNYWLIQNSWGNWGDNGFVKFDIVDGDGVLGVNNVAEYANVVAV